uniref:Ubiquitin-like protease family profile domain-containing protein n=1 Tax=Trichogramma kaykai TaxID=54128 RepID=A0ABD2W6V3_9HYME
MGINKMGHILKVTKLIDSIKEATVIIELQEDPKISRHDKDGNEKLNENDHFKNYEKNSEESDFEELDNVVEVNTMTPAEKNDTNVNENVVQTTNPPNPKEKKRPPVRRQPKACEQIKWSMAIESNLKTSREELFGDDRKYNKKKSVVLPDVDILSPQEAHTMNTRNLKILCDTAENKTAIISLMNKTREYRISNDSKLKLNDKLKKYPHLLSYEGELRNDGTDIWLEVNDEVISETNWSTLEKNAYLIFMKEIRTDSISINCLRVANNSNEACGNPKSFNIEAGNVLSTILGSCGNDNSHFNIEMLTKEASPVNATSISQSSYSDPQKSVDYFLNYGTHLDYILFLLKQLFRNEHYTPLLDQQIFCNYQLEPSCRSKKHIQIIHSCEDNCASCKKGHWICLYFNTKAFYIYDSCNYGYLNETQEKFIHKLFPYANEYNFFYPQVQMQQNDRDCGIFAIAFAISLALKIDPKALNYVYNALQPHIYRIFTEYKTLVHCPVLEEKILSSKSIFSRIPTKYEVKPITNVQEDKEYYIKTLIDKIDSASFSDRKMEADHLVTHCIYLRDDKLLKFKNSLRLCKERAEMFLARLGGIVIEENLECAITALCGRAGHSSSSEPWYNTGAYCVLERNKEDYEKKQVGDL